MLPAVEQGQRVARGVEPEPKHIDENVDGLVCWVCQFAECDDDPEEPRTALHGLRVLPRREQRRLGARELPGQRGGAPAEALGRLPDLQERVHRGSATEAVPHTLGAVSEPPGG
jgi:hypothetical protein